MKFAENPKIFINEYFDDKRNTIDLNCEKIILQNEEETKNEVPQEMHQNLNKLRDDLIEKIAAVKAKVIERYDSLFSNYNEETPTMNTDLIKDQIFLDQYCTVFNVYKHYPLFDLKLGLLLFSEYDDHLIGHFK